MAAVIEQTREAVATSQLPQLKRGTDDRTTRSDLEQAVRRFGGSPGEARQLVAEARRLNAEDLLSEEVLKAAGTPKPKVRPKKKARESEPFTAVVREADFAKRGAAFECVILRAGPGNSRDRRMYTPEALREAVAAGKFEGLRAYLNHPTADQERSRPERDVTHLAGHFKEARFVPGPPAEVRAKFVPGGMDKERVTSLIESALGSPENAPLCAISIDGYGRTDGTQEVNGQTYELVREISKLGSADIVTQTATGGRFVRKLSEAAQEPLEDLPAVGPRKYRKRVQKAAERLGEATDEHELADAYRQLREAVAAPLKPRKRPEPDIVEDGRLEELGGKLREADAALQRLHTWAEHNGYGQVEGVGARPRGDFPMPGDQPHGGGLLSRMGIES